MQPELRIKVKSPDIRKMEICYNDICKILEKYKINTLELHLIMYYLELSKLYTDFNKLYQKDIISKSVIDSHVI